MLQRFISWLKRLFSSGDESLDENDDNDEKTSGQEKIGVISCEVVSIEFEEES